MFMLTNIVEITGGGCIVGIMNADGCKVVSYTRNIKKKLVILYY